MRKPRDKIATKAPAFAPGSLAYERIVRGLKVLGVEKVDIYYLHGTDARMSLEEQCRAIGRLYKEGKFERFGVGDLRGTQVQEIYDICEREGHCLPSVYRGGYNLLQRGCEEGLFPLLRKLGMALYAYSPLAGGLLAKRVEEVVDPKAGMRFAEMQVFRQMYLGDQTLEELRKLTASCEENEIGFMEATLKWFMHHSPLRTEDGLILGAGSKEVVEKSLEATEKEPLSETLKKQFKDLWEAIKPKVQS